MKLLQALRYEKFDVTLFRLCNGAASSFLHDFRLISHLKTFDIIIYTGSIARTSSLFLNGKKIVLFIHGFLQDEYKSTILYNAIRTKLGALVEFTWWKSVNMNLFKPDLYICHSVTTCKANGIASSHVFLPQFILPDEIDYFEKLKNNCGYLNEIPKIVSYRSYADSPRLLSQASLVRMARLLAKRLKRKVLFYVIDPMIPHEEIYEHGLMKLSIVRAMPRIKFLQFLASADLYVEPGIDEEIGLDTLEAGLLEVPLAKITYPEYKRRQDYTENEVIIAPSQGTLVDMLSEYLNNVEYYKQYYGRKFKQFLLTKRLWNVVKTPLLTELEK